MLSESASKFLNAFIHRFGKGGGGPAGGLDGKLGGGPGGGPEGGPAGLPPVGRGGGALFLGSAGNSLFGVEGTEPLDPDFELSFDNCLGGPDGLK